MSAILTLVSALTLCALAFVAVTAINKVKRIAAEEKRRIGIGRYIQDVCAVAYDLAHEMGTTQHLEYGQVEGVAVSSTLRDWYRPLYVELIAVCVALDLTEDLNAKGGIHYGDVVYFEDWVGSIKERFQREVASNEILLRRLRHQLAETRALYTEIGMAYYAARCNPAYEAFPGMLHVVELLVEESSMPAEQLTEYVVALTKQLSMLVASFEKAIIEDEAPVWIYAYNERCQHLQAFLAGLEPSIS